MLLMEYIVNMSGYHMITTSSLAYDFNKQDAHIIVDGGMALTRMDVVFLIRAKANTTQARNCGISQGA